VSPARRRLLIAALAVVAAVLAWQAPEPVSDAVVPATVGGASGLPPLRPWPERPRYEPLPARDAPLARLRDDDAAAAAPKRPAPPALPPAPVAPALPFKYLGQLQTEDGATVFLSAGGKTVPVQAGGLIDNVYRVEAVSAARIDFTHLPTGTAQSLTIARP